MRSYEYISFPIDDDGHVAHVKVSAIHTVADTIDPNLSSVYTVGGAFTVAQSTATTLAQLETWHENKLRKVN